jgi:hypothetical protein
MVAHNSTALQLQNVVALMQNFTQLQALVLSDLGLFGPLETPGLPGFAAFKQLRHLDISQNPGITGTLPDSWQFFSDLQTLDIAHTGIAGTLPASYAALQQLKAIRALICTGITGQLPPEWGFMNLEVLELTNTGLSGVLPVEWVDGAAVQRAWLEEAADVEASIAAGRHADTSAAAAAAGVQPTALGGLQQLRVLDLSVEEPYQGRMSGRLPDNFAALGQLKVCIQISRYQQQRTCVHMHEQQHPHS